MTDFYTDAGVPSTGSALSSAVVRSEFSAIATAFAKLAAYTGNGGKVVAVNTGGTAYEAVATTGSGSIVRASGVLGTPASGVLTNCTGLPISTGIAGLGTGIATALAVNTGSAGAPVLFNGAGGTPTSLVGTNITGTAAGLTAGKASAAAASPFVIPKQDSAHEGGEINLAISDLSTLSANVAIDLLDNTFRVFENGGSTRGMSIDMSGLPAGIAAQMLVAKAQSIAASGYMWIGALLVQWGTATSSGTALGNTTVTFPIAFPTATHFAIGTQLSTASYQAQCILYSKSTSGAVFTAGSTSGGSSGVTIYWIAIGN